VDDGIRGRNVTRVQTCALPIEQLPKHIMAVTGEVQRDIDRLKTNRTKLQKYADYTKPHRDYDQNVATFRAQHRTTLAEPNQAARSEERRVGNEVGYGGRGYGSR